METQAKLDFKVTMSNFQAGEFEFSFLFIWIFSFIHIICACSITRDGFLLFGDILGNKHDKNIYMQTVNSSIIIFTFYFKNFIDLFDCVGFAVCELLVAVCGI